MMVWPPNFNISAVIWHTPGDLRFFKRFTVSATSLIVGGGSSSGASVGRTDFKTSSSILRSGLRSLTKYSD